MISFMLIYFPSGWTVAGATEIGIQLGVKLTDEELNQVRGGYAGFHFGIEFTGYWDNVGNMSGSLVYNENGASNLPEAPEGFSPVPGNDLLQTDLGGVSIQAYVGNFDGASGIFQISQSPGSFNVIHNNLILNITVINVTDESALPSLLPYLPLQ